MALSTNNNAPEAENALQRSKRQLSTQEYLTNLWQRVRSGDLGQFPIVLGLIVICIIFQIANPIFLSQNNLVNLLVQSVTVITMAYGVVIILLLGEIDLSLGYTAGISAVAIALLVRAPIVIPGITSAEGFVVPWYLAVVIALSLTALIGFIQGSFVTFFKLPSFIVTIAGQLALSGLVLLTVKGLGTLSMRDPVILGTVRAYLDPIQSLIFAIIVVLAYSLTQLSTARSRRASGLAGKPAPVIILESIGLAIVMGGILYITTTSRYQGIPFAFVLIFIMYVVLSYITTQTRFGRYLFAVGGNKEAARRAGIPVERIRIMGFMLGSFMAGVSGIFLVARLSSVATNTGGGNELLSSISAAVIGGTSLFGGNGKISSALLGGLVIGVVDSGLGLIPNIPADAKFIFTAVILMLAVIVDSLARRNQTNR